MGHCTNALFAGEKFKTPFRPFSYILRFRQQKYFPFPLVGFFFLHEFVTTGRFLDKTRSPQVSLTRLSTTRPRR